MTWVKNFDLYARYVSKILLYDEKEKMDWRLFLIFMQYKIAFSAGKKKCSNFKIIRLNFKRKFFEIFLTAGHPLIVPKGVILCQ